MGQEQSKKFEELSITWGNLPKPALIQIFKYLSVTDLIQIAFHHKRTLWHDVSMLNEVWESKY